MSRRPIIGITPSLEEENELQNIQLNYIYAAALVEAGGLPVILPPFQEKGLIQECLTRIDGLLLSGGVDVDPLLFQEEPHPRMGRIDPYRDFFELEAVRGIWELKKPCLGICRGCQVINMALGGSIFQDLELQKKEGLLKHTQQAPRWYPTHSVTVKDGSLLHRIYGHSRLVVNSFHHQVVKEPPPHFQIAAWAPDGIIEAIEHTRDPFIIGVQWHPETLWEKDEKTRDLFRYFVNQAKE